MFNHSLNLNVVIDVSANGDFFVLFLYDYIFLDLNLFNVSSDNFRKSFPTAKLFSCLYSDRLYFKTYLESTHFPRKKKSSEQQKYSR
jgi:hypothetical protein